MSHLRRAWSGLARVSQSLGRGLSRPSWHLLVDEFRITTYALQQGIPCHTTARRPILTFPEEPLPEEHVYAVVSQGHVALGPEPTGCAVIPNRMRHYGVFLSIACATVAELERTFVLSLGDFHLPAPVAQRPTLVFNRERNALPGIVLVPDVDFVKGRGLARLRHRIDRALIPWRQRHSQVVWRGSSTGLLRPASDGELTNARLELCRVAKRFEQRVDCRISRLVQGVERDEAKYAAEGLLASVLSQEQQAQSRWLISIDGNAAEWEGLFWKLYSGSTVLVVESQWEQWYSSRLVPWEHFVPVSADLSDLDERLEWCFGHESECEAIGQRARQLMRSEVTFRSAVDCVVRAMQLGEEPSA